ncbi:hypothetical protein AKJ09_03335 [Labilithrix luteola]|uniref:Uncharacterized protein n=1 Tax=Labilithrix luteola TaxID=1391654 RepID=A0A0K1PTG4_9BACT|nr:hypothetical protein AKJ09_03335 [Labilithrix luteola]
MASDSEAGREMARVLATTRHVEIARRWPGGPQAFFEERRNEWQRLLVALKSGADPAAVHATLNVWLKALLDRG